MPQLNPLFQPLTQNSAAQTPYDVAVIIQTTGRPSLLRALRSVFRQDYGGRVQILIGVDCPFDQEPLATLVAEECPAGMAVGIFYPGYSTSQRHGGLSPNHYGGALRTILSYTANSPYVAYLDDDDWWGANHLASLMQAIVGKQWAFSLRWLVDDATGWPICPDEWDSLGPGKGINAERFGGFVSPSNLLIAREAFQFFFPLWSLAAFDDGSGEDRLVFNELKNLEWGSSGQHTCFYSLRPEHQREPHHRQEFLARGIRWLEEPGHIQRLTELLTQARKHLQQGESEHARQTCGEALALNPYFAPALHLQAEALWHAGDQAGAVDLRCQAIAIDDREKNPYLALARQLESMGAMNEVGEVRAIISRRFGD